MTFWLVSLFIVGLLMIGWTGWGFVAIAIAIGMGMGS